jgi:flavoprotein
MPATSEFLNACSEEMAGGDVDVYVRPSTKESIPVNDVRQEYDFLKQQPCDSCGSTGTTRCIGQKLIRIEGRPHDVLNCECEECGNFKEYLFDVTEAFDKYRQFYEEP